MSVQYLLIPVDKETGTIIDSKNLDLNQKNDFTIFAEIMINFPNNCIAYFDKHELFFDFVLSLKETELSKTTYQPENLRNLFVELLEILNTKSGFPVESFLSFSYEEMMETNFLYVILKGSELNRITEDKSYHPESVFSISTSFDRLNNYSFDGEYFTQNKPRIYITDSEGERFWSDLDLSSFPGKLKIIQTQKNIKLGKEIKTIILNRKTPFNYYYSMFRRLIEFCKLCEEKKFAIKSLVYH